MFGVKPKNEPFDYVLPQNVAKEKKLEEQRSFFKQNLVEHSTNDTNVGEEDDEHEPDIVLEFSEANHKTSNNGEDLTEVKSCNKE